MTSLTAWDREEREERALPMAGRVGTCVCVCMNVCMKKGGGKICNALSWRKPLRQVHTRGVIVVEREVCSGSINDVQRAFGPF